MGSTDELNGSACISAARRRGRRIEVEFMLTNCVGIVPLNLLENKYIVFNACRRSNDLESVPVN